MRGFLAVVVLVTLTLSGCFETGESPTESRTDPGTPAQRGVPAVRWIRSLTPSSGVRVELTGLARERLAAVRYVDGLFDTPAGDLDAASLDEVRTSLNALSLGVLEDERLMLIYAHAGAGQPSSPAELDHILGLALESTMPRVARPIHIEAAIRELVPAGPPMSVHIGRHIANVGYLGEVECGVLERIADDSARKILNAIANDAHAPEEATRRATDALGRLRAADSDVVN